MVSFRLALKTLLALPFCISSSKSIGSFTHKPVTDFGSRFTRLWRAEIGKGSFVATVDDGGDAVEVVVRHGRARREAEATVKKINSHLSPTTLASYLPSPFLPFLILPVSIVF